MVVVDKEIKKGQYYFVNGNVVCVIYVNGFDVYYFIFKLYKCMICDCVVFSLVVKEIKFYG